MPLRTNRHVVSIDEALRVLEQSGPQVTRTGRLPLGEVAGRVLAEDIVAHTDVPPFARAAMDGYAVVATDTARAAADAPVSLRLVARVYTGAVASGGIRPGECIGIATGAPVPPGADAVVMIEQTARYDDVVHVHAAVRSGQNIGRQGGDISAGQLVLREGTWLTPARAGVLAALGLADASVYERPRVAIVCTGDEIVEPGRPLGPGQIHDVNGTTLAAVIRQHGGEPVVHPQVRDDRDAIRRAFATSLDSDLVLLSGGSSVGERDHILDVIEERGGVRFEGIAVKPGQPTIFAVTEGRPVFGMPGNPTSCLSNAYLLVVPMLRRMARLPPLPRRTVRARLSRGVQSPARRHQFYPVRIDGDAAVPAFKGSGDITSMAEADGYFEIAAATEQVDAGAWVEVVLF